MRKILIALFISLTLKADIIDGISVVVESEPITIFEIYRASKELKLPFDETIEKLIEFKLREIEIEKLDIEISDFQIEQELESIALKSNLTLFQFKEALELRGVSLQKYRDSLKKKLEQDKLNQKISYSKLKDIDIDELKTYYQNNLDEFTIAKDFEVIKYESNSKEALESSIKNPMNSIPNVDRERETLSADEINPRLLFILNDTKESKFTPILTTSNSYVTFFILTKAKKEFLGFEEVKDAIFSKIVKDKEEKILKEYFEKLKSKAQIDIVRLPS